LNDQSMLVKLIDLETMLQAVVRSVGRAERNLVVAVREFPSSTPLNGSPGGGSGGASILVHGDDADEGDDWVPVTSVESIVLDDVIDLPSVELARLRASARVSASSCSRLVAELVGQVPIDPGPKASVMQLAVHAFRCAIVARHEGAAGRFAPYPLLAAAVGDSNRLHRVVAAWGFVAAKPPRSKEERRAARAEMPVDLTDMWCVSCLRVGVRWPRWRKDLCEWCARFTYTEGFMVPVEIVEARHEHKRITERMVEPHRKRHQDRLAYEAEQARRDANATTRPGRAR
jgi:hypothetical protein